MKYITVKEAAEKFGINERRVRVLLKEQRIEGAILKGHKYLIPDNAPKPLYRLHPWPLLPRGGENM